MNKNKNTIQNMDSIVNDNINLVRSLAHKFSKLFKGYGIEYDDLFQQGILGLHAAATKYNSKKFPNTKFSTYAFQWIRKYIQVYVDKQKQQCLISDDKTMRVISLDEKTNQRFGGDDSGSDGYNGLHIEISSMANYHGEYVQNDEFKYVLETMKKTLSKVEYTVLTLRFLEDEKQTLMTISETLGVSISRARMIEQDALAKLKNILHKAV